MMHTGRAEPGIGREASRGTFSTEAGLGDEGSRAWVGPPGHFVCVRCDIPQCVRARGDGG
jgi:hypothetical protein